MDSESLPNHIVYSKNVIEFVTVTAETCIFFERTYEIQHDEFVRKAVKILPLLYLKAVLLERPEPVFEEIPERFVTEEDYLYVKDAIASVLGADDAFLEVFHPDMAYSDTPIAAFISENMADVYQELKDFAVNYQTGDADVMNDSLVYCLDMFEEHWGQKLLNTLRALHSIRYSDAFGVDEVDDEATEAGRINRDTFFDFQK